MSKRNTDLLPFDYSGQIRLLPWMMAAMMYLAALVLAALFASHTILEKWDQNVRGSLIVQVLTTDDAQDKLDRLEKILKSQKTVRDYTILSEDTGKKLLEPWFGDDALINELPIPRLIDVRLQDNTDPAPLIEKLRDVEGVIVSDQKHWLKDLATFARSIQWIAFGSFLVVAFVGSLTVILSTKASLAINQDIISMLYLMGAENEYISKQVSAYTLRHSLLGGFVGAGLAILTILFLQHMAPQANQLLLPVLHLSPYHWAMLVFLPLLGLGLSIFTARISIHYRLIKEDPYR